MGRGIKIREEFQKLVTEMSKTLSIDGIILELKFTKVYFYTVLGNKEELKNALKNQPNTLNQIIGKHYFFRLEDTSLVSTPLGIAIQIGDYEIIKFLVEQGADLHLSSQPQNISQALQIALKSHNCDPEIFQYLEEKSQINLSELSNFQKNTFLYDSLQVGHAGAVKYLIETKKFPFFAEEMLPSILGSAIRQGHSSIVQYLVEEKGIYNDACLKDAFEIMYPDPNKSKQSDARYPIHQKIVYYLAKALKDLDHVLFKEQTILECVFEICNLQQIQEIIQTHLSLSQEIKSLNLIWPINHQKIALFDLLLQYRNPFDKPKENSQVSAYKLALEKKDEPFLKLCVLYAANKNWNVKKVEPKKKIYEVIIQTLEPYYFLISPFNARADNCNEDLLWINFPIEIQIKILCLFFLEKLNMDLWEIGWTYSYFFTLLENIYNNNMNKGFKIIASRIVQIRLQEKIIPPSKKTITGRDKKERKGKINQIINNTESNLRKTDSSILLLNNSRLRYFFFQEVRSHQETVVLPKRKGRAYIFPKKMLQVSKKALENCREKATTQSKDIVSTEFVKHFFNHSSDFRKNAIEISETIFNKSWKKIKNPNSWKPLKTKKSILQKIASSRIYDVLLDLVFEKNSDDLLKTELNQEALDRISTALSQSTFTFTEIRSILRTQLFSEENTISHKRKREEDEEGKENIVKI